MAIIIASATLFLILSTNKLGPTSNTNSTGTTHAQAAMQLNPPLSVAWKFGGQFTTTSNTTFLSNGEIFSGFFNSVSDDANVYATTTKVRGNSTLGTYLLAVSLESGKAIWELMLPPSPEGAKFSGLTFLNNDSSTHMLIVGVEGALVAVDDRQGRAIWSVNGSQGFPLASPDGRVYTAVGAFWGKNGTKICGYQAGSYGGRILAYGDGRVYSMVEAGQKGVLVAFDALSCQRLWSTSVGSNGNHWANYWSVFHNGRVYAADVGSLYSIDPADGKIVWNVTHGFLVSSQPTVVGNVAYLTGRVGIDNQGEPVSAVGAFNATNGILLWRSDSISGPSLRPSISGKLLYAPIGCTIEALDSRTGKTTWQWSLRGCNDWFTYYGPLISGPYLILSASISYLVAFRGTLGG